MSSNEALAAYVPEKLSREGRELAEQLVRGIEDLSRKVARLGSLIASMSDEDRAIFIDAFPSHYQRIWRDLHRVGMGEMNPKLVTASGRAAQMLKKLPIAEQNAYVVELIPVVTGDDRRAVKYFDIENMPVDLVPQVFAQGGGRARVRAVDEQRVWRAQQAVRKAEADLKRESTEVSRPNRWAVRNGRAYLSPALVSKGLTLEDVQRLLADLKL